MIHSRREWLAAVMQAGLGAGIGTSSPVTINGYWDFYFGGPGGTWVVSVRLFKNGRGVFRHRNLPNGPMTFFELDQDVYLSGTLEGHPGIDIGVTLPALVVIRATKRSQTLFDGWVLLLGTTDDYTKPPLFMESITHPMQALKGRNP